MSPASLVLWLRRGGYVFSSATRRPVATPAGAKAGLSHYLNGLDHKFRSAGLQTVLVKPGFVRTGMTAGLPAPPFAADAEDVAPLVLRAIDKGTPEVFVPGIWRWIMLVIRSMPRFVMRRLSF